MSAGRQFSFRHLMKGMMLKGMYGMITCEQFESFVVDYLEGSLPRGQRRRFEWHLRLCRECREYLASYRRALEIGRAVMSTPDQMVSDDVPEELIDAIVDSLEQR